MPGDGRVVWRGPWLVYESPALEADYWQEQQSSIYALSTAYVGTLALALLASWRADFRLLGASEKFAWLLALRVLLALLSAGMVVFIRRRPARRTLEWTLLIWGLVMVAGHGVIASTKPIGYFATLVNGRSFVLLSFLMLPSAWALSTPYSLLMSAIYSVLIARHMAAGGDPTFTSNTLAFLTVNALICLWSIHHEYGRRRQFAVLRSETKLRRDLSDLKRALDVHALVTIADARGRIIAVNHRFCETAKFLSEELIGSDHRILNSGTHSPAFMAELWATVSGGRVWHGELCNRSKDGSLFWVDTTIVPLAGADGPPREYITLYTDITHRKSVETVLQAAKDAADEANRAKSDFLATMSHEIRTPMNGVLGFANLLSETSLTDEQRRFVSTIRGSGETLMAILNDILDFSKIEAGQLSLERIPYDLRKTVHELVDLMTVRASQKHLVLTLQVASDVPARLLGDSGRLRQVLLNLVGNALKFTHEGQVRVDVSLAPGGAVAFAVEDTGIGLKPSEISRLFRHFSQADASTTRRFGGTGLGLAISKRLVELMGGAIGVESEEGRGSRFWFTVPGPPDELAQAEESPVRVRGADAVVVSGPGGRALRVLLAEDNATNQFLAKRLLEMLGCAVDVAGNGREAVDLWSRLPYDVVFMDCQMPEMDGLVATAEIRRREQMTSIDAPAAGARVRVVACTAGVTTGEREACVAAGMDDFIAKPLSKDDLCGALLRSHPASSTTKAA